MTLWNVSATVRVQSFDRALYPRFPMFFEPARSYTKEGLQQLCEALNLCALGARS